MAALLFLIEWLLVKRVIALFGNRHFSPLWALFPVAADWIFFANIGYTISIPFAFILILSVFLIYTQIGHKWASLFTGLLLIPFLYWIAGAGMFFFALILVLYEIRQKRIRIAYWVIILLLAAAIPYLFRPVYLLTIKQAYLFPYPGLKETLPFIVLFVMLILMLFRPVKEMERHVVPFALSIASAPVFLIAGLWINTRFEQEKILAITTEYYYGNNDKVIELAEKYEFSKPIVSYYTNLALSSRGELGDRLMDYYQPAYHGLFLPDNSDTDWFTLFFSNDVFFYVGDMNLATRSAMQGIISSPYNQSARLVMRLAEINVITNDKPAAEKYIRILERAWFYKEKAQELRALLDEDLAEQSAWLQQKRSQSATRDIIRTAENYPAALNILLESNPKNREALDYLLCYYLLDKNLDGFKAAFDRYHTGTAERCYQQALLIYFAEKGTKQKEIDKYQLHKQMIDGFNRYNECFEESEGNLDTMQEAFPRTYWLYYHFGTMTE